MNVFDRFVQKFNLDENTIKWIGLTTDITADTDAWQNHFTPDSVCDQMVEMYKQNFNNQQQILVMFNVELIKSIYLKYEDVLLKNIYFIADTQKKFEFVQKFFPKINLCLLEKHDINNLNECIKGFNVKKFDIVFSNPPYNGNLDLKILESLFEQKVSDKIVFVHPSTFLLDKKFKTKLYNEIRNTNYLESVNLFWGNKLFDIELQSPCGITVWNINKTSDECTVTDAAFINWTGNESKYSCKINDISIHGKIVNTYKHIFYISDKYSSILEHRVFPDYSNMTDISIKFSRLRGGNEYGHGIYSHFHSLLCLNTDSHKCDNTFRCKRDVDGERLVWSFNNEIERDNFINYCKTKVIRFILSYYKNNVDLSRGQMLNAIPWLDFTQEWNDKKLCEEFGISEELWNYIDNFIPDYYDDYNSGF